MTAITATRPVTKVRVAQRQPDTRLIHAVVNGRTDRDLASVLDSYSVLLGRPVSQSVAIRRALDLLADHVGNLTHPDRERAALAMHIR